MAPLIWPLLVVALLALCVARELAFRRERARMAQERLAFAASLKERQELAEVSQLVSGIAQELKSPLQGVIGGTELMLESAASGAPAVEELRQIRDEATRAAGIVRNLLAFTEPTALNRRWLDLSTVVARAVDVYRSAHRDVTVVVEAADRLPLVYVDGRRLEKVINTFLSVSDAAGLETVSRITIATSRLDDERLAIDIAEEGVANRGDDEALWSTELAACHHVMEAHGGRLAVARGASGVRVRLELPVAAGESTAV